LAVALECINVIVRKAAVERRFPGGLDGFARHELIGVTLAEDDHLMRVGFMSGSDAFRFVTELEAAGLLYREEDDSSDVAVVVSGGDAPPWLAVGDVNGSPACWASDHPAGELARPEPGFLLRCPRGVYDSLAEVVGNCGAEVQEVAPEPGYLAGYRCTRGEAEITILVAGEQEGAVVGLGGWRQMERRSQFHADVALIRDLEAALIHNGAEG